MKFIVVHDALGKIVSIARVEPGVKQRKVGFSVGIMPQPGQSVLESEISGDLAKKSLSDIHNECCVDLKARKLIKRPR